MTISMIHILFTHLRIILGGVGLCLASCLASPMLSAEEVRDVSPSHRGRSDASGSAKEAAQATAAQLPQTLSNDHYSNDALVNTSNVGNQGILALPPRDVASTRIHKSTSDPNEYRYLILSNGLKVLLIRAPSSAKSAVAMNVEAGSADEQKGKAGLAHFLEHMLFLGSDRYPQASKYSQYLHAHGGRENAYTDFDRTNYQLEVTRDYLPEALARFSRFFIAPLLSEDIIERERFAVKSEYELSFSDNSYRFYDALWQASSKAHPINHPVLGDMATLSAPPAKLKRELKQFFERHYSANRMQLVIMSGHTLDEMAEYATQFFGEIPNRQLPKRAPLPPILTPDKLPARMNIESDTGNHHLVFYFPIPDPMVLPHQVPYNFVSTLISHQGEGTLANRLMEKGWISRLEADLPVRDQQHALMYVDFQLTEKGEAHIDDIRATFFDYMKLIQTHAITSWRNTENARLAALQFSAYSPNIDMETAGELSSTLAYSPPSEINITGLRSNTATEATLAAFMRFLTPENMLQLYNGSNVDVEHYSPRYRVGYRWEKIHQWPKGLPVTPLHLPLQNQFIPKQLTLHSIQDYRPRRLINEQGMDVWYQGDHHYHSPRVEWRIRFMNPNTQRSLQERTLTALLVQWLNQSLEKNTYSAQLALQFMNIATDRDGIATSFSVWNTQPAQLITAFTDTLLNTPVTPSNFEKARVAYIQAIQGKVKPQLYNALLDTLDRQLTPHMHEDSAVVAELNKLGPADLEHFRKEWLKSLHIQVMAVGNVTSDTVMNIANTLHKCLAPGISLNEIPRVEAVSLPSQQTHLQPLLKDYTDAATLLYFQPPAGLRARATTRLIEQLIQPEFYAIMRTTRQLGYIVNTEYYPVLSRAGLLMLIESSDFPSDTLKNEIRDFTALMTRQLQTLTGEQLEFAKKAVEQEWFLHQNTLGGLADKQAHLLELNNIGFDLPYQLQNILKTIDIKDIQMAWRELIHSPALLITHDPEPSTEGSSATTVEHNNHA